MSSEPFYRLLDEDGKTTRVEATGSTAGPWFDDAQHMGPAGALLVRALERCSGRDDVRLARLTVEVLGRVPLGEMTVSGAVERSGRTIELVGAELVAGGRAVARAHGWFHVAAPTTPTEPAAPTMEPASAGEIDRPPAPGWLPGYMTAMQWSWLEGGLDVAGPGRVWVRQRVPLVEGEEPTPCQRLVTVADSTNGAGGRLDLNRWLYVNTDLSVHLHRVPRGEWIGLDADSVIGPEGSGTAFSTVHDEGGPVGRAAQALTVRPR